jgi:hypothetical protein
MTDETREGFYKVKMPTYYIAKHSDEDLRAAVLAEREECAKICDARAEADTWEGGYAHQCANEIRARSAI